MVTNRWSRRSGAENDISHRSTLSTNFKKNEPGISLAALELVRVLVIGFNVRFESETVRVLCIWPAAGSDIVLPALLIADLSGALFLLESCLGRGIGVFPDPFP